MRDATVSELGVILIPPCILSGQKNRGGLAELDTLLSLYSMTGTKLTSRIAGRPVTRAENSVPQEKESI
jgi:hypothetical protein